MDRDGAKIILENIDELRANGTAVMITSVLFKDAIMVGEKAYRLDNDGLVELNNREAFLKLDKWQWNVYIRSMAISGGGKAYINYSIIILQGG